MDKHLPHCSKQSPPPKGPKVYDLSQRVAAVMNDVESWSKGEKFQLASELIKSLRDDKESCKKLMNLARDCQAKEKKDTLKGVAPEAEVCGQQRNVDPGASYSNHQEAEALPPEAVATKIPLLCRGDLLVNTKLLFFDTEKVTISNTHENKSGDIAIVDIKGRLLFWAYIRQENVCKFNTKLTGLDEEKMKMGLPVETVKEIISKLVIGKELWGASTTDDVKSLGFSTGFFSSSCSINDIQSFFRDYKDQPISLGQLSEHFLGANVQGKTHSAITDARLTALCYRKMIKFQELGMKRFSCPVMDEMRTKKVKKQPMAFDKCTCGKQTNKGMHASKVYPERFSSFNNLDLDSFL